MREETNKCVAQFASKRGNELVKRANRTRKVMTLSIRFEAEGMDHDERVVE